MTLRHRLYLWFFTTDSNKRLPSTDTTGTIWVWLAAATFPRPMRLSACHEPPCWIDAQGNAHETTDTRWRLG